MKKGQLYSITALFDTPDLIISAAQKAVSKGYSKFDVHTPYPVHGMDRAMNLKSSTIGLFAFIFGLLGALSCIAFITWTTVIDYPIVIGGKPFWSWPAYVPVSFELTVLSTAVFSAILMIVFYLKLPNNAHPLHDTHYMKNVSSDKFGMSIQADDPKFNRRDVERFLASAGGKNIASIYFDEEERLPQIKIFDPKFIGVLLVIALTVSVVTYYSLNIMLYQEPFSWMAEQNKLKAQQPAPFFKDSLGMRTPDDATVSRSFLPFAFKDKPDDAGKFLVNPYLSTKDVLEKGRSKFLTFCSPCHGNFATGESRLQGQFPNPPTLHSDKVRKWTDGRMFYVITEGQNAMPGYASQITPEERWQIIHYIRALQRAENPKESDFK